MEYGDVLWDGCTEGESDVLEFVQYETAKIVTGAMKGTSRRSLMHEIGWEDLKVSRSIHKLIFYFKIVHNLTPNYLKELLPCQVFERTQYSFRSCSDYTLFPVRTERFFLPPLWRGTILTFQCVILSRLFYLKTLWLLFSMFHITKRYLTFLLIDILLSFTLVHV